MFTKQHERELAEIKALTYELGQRFQDILERLEHVKVVQDQLVAQAQDQPATTAKRKADRPKVKAVDGGAPQRKAAGAKKARSGRPGAGAKAARRPRKAVRGASDSPQQTTNRRRRSTASSREAPGGGTPPKRRKAKPAPSSGSHEE